MSGVKPPIPENMKLSATESKKSGRGRYGVRKTKRRKIKGGKRSDKS